MYIKEICICIYERMNMRVIDLLLVHSHVASDYIRVQWWQGFGWMRKCQNIKVRDRQPANKKRSSFPRVYTVIYTSHVLHKTSHL